MGDVGETFKAWNEEKKEKRKNNLKDSTKILKENNITFESKNGGVHLIIDSYDFWPSTGLFIHRKTKEKGRGIFNLIKRLNKQQN